VEICQSTADIGKGLCDLEGKTSFSGNRKIPVLGDFQGEAQIPREFVEPEENAGSSSIDTG
jgi:hypothetical protein